MTLTYDALKVKLQNYKNSWKICSLMWICSLWTLE